MAFLVELGSRVVSPDASVFVRSLRVRDTSDATYETLTSPSYSIRDEAGTVLWGPETPTGTGTTTLSIADSSDPPEFVTGTRYREEWTYSISGVVQPPVIADLYVQRVTLDPPFTSADLVREQSHLLTAGAPYDDEILAVRDEAIGRLLGETAASRADLWDAYKLRNWWFYRTLAVVIRNEAGGTGGPLLDLADGYDARAEAYWSRITLSYDTDGDGDVDSAPATAARQAVR